MNFEITPDLEKELKKIKTHDRQLFQKIDKQLNLFQENHLHPSLRTHKLTAKLQNIWSISIDKKIRMLYLLIEDTAHFFDIGTHDEVYRK